MNILLLIQGDKTDAIKAAAKRKIPLTFVKDMPLGRSLGKAPESYRENAIDWYEENGGDDCLAPFPAGTLMEIIDA